MKPEQKTLRIGAFAIVLAVVLRLFGGGTLDGIVAALTHPKVSAALLYAGTGRVLTLAPQLPPDATDPLATEPSVTEPNPTEAPEKYLFQKEDAATVSMTNYPGYSVDVAAMLEQPLSWDLTTEEPAVLILHAHTSESYENTEGYKPSGSYRTTDERYNMVSIGAHLAQCLQEKGISVIHDTTLHDSPSYNDAYALSRKTAQAYLQKYPSIRLVLDIHRDAYEDSQGNQASSTVTAGGMQCSRLMIVAGTDAYGEDHDNWRDNLSLAVKLQTILTQRYPGLCRSLAVRSSAFNQDLSPGALLIEVGTAGDTRQDALNAASLLAEGIAQLAYGSA